jgi:hypothetical protein
MIPFESHYGRKYNTLVIWDNPSYHTVVGIDLVREMEEKMVKIRKTLRDT